MSKFLYTRAAAATSTQVWMAANGRSLLPSPPQGAPATTWYVPPAGVGGAGPQGQTVVIECERLQQLRLYRPSQTNSPQHPRLTTTASRVYGGSPVRQPYRLDEQVPDVLLTSATLQFAVADDDDNGGDGVQRPYGSKSRTSPTRPAADAGPMIGGQAAPLCVATERGQNK